MLDFFSMEIRELDDELLQLAASIGGQIGPICLSRSDVHTGNDEIRAGKNVCNPRGSLSVDELP